MRSYLSWNGRGGETWNRLCMRLDSSLLQAETVHILNPQSGVGEKEQPSVSENEKEGLQVRPTLFLLSK
jgi:hypothetical protein